MADFLQQSANGLILGGLYTVFGLAYLSIYRSTQLVHLPLGDVAGVSGLVGITLFSLTGAAGGGVVAGLLLAGSALGAAVVAAAGSWAIYRSLYRRLVEAPHRLVAALGAAVSLQGLALVAWGREGLRWPAGMVSVYDLGPFAVTNLGLLILLLSGALVVLVLRWQSVKEGRLFLYLGAVAGVGGVLATLYYGLGWYLLGFSLMLKGLAAALIGLLFGVPGAVGAGILLGLSETLGGTYLPLLADGLFFEGQTDLLTLILVIAALALRQLPFFRRAQG